MSRLPRRSRSGGSVLSFLLLVVIATASFAQTPTARFKNFQAPTPDRNGRKSILKGADASHIGNGIFHIIGPHVETYKPDDSIDMTIDATECLFDKDNSKDVWSEKDLSMKTADGRLSLKGVGFRWISTESRLVVSNQVEAVIARDTLAQGAAGAQQPSTNTLKVTSKAMDYRPDLIVFYGDVHVVDAQGEVQCQTLKVRYDERNTLQEVEALDDVTLTQDQTQAHGRRALYSPTSGLLRLYENTTWRMADRHGSSELLILDRTNNTIRAETKVRMTFPSTLLATNTPGQAAPTNRTEVTIAAETFDYAPTNALSHGPIAIFNGDVHAIDPQATLDCQLLTIFFNQTNKLVRAVADREVQISRPDTKISGPRAVFENDEVTVDQPKWKLQDRTGSSDTLTFNPRTREAHAAHNVRMLIPFSSATNFLLTATNPQSTNGAPQLTTNLLLITAEFFTNKNDVATFSQNARASEPRGQIDANLLAVEFGSSNQVARIIADGDVILTEQKSQAIAQRAVYDRATEKIRLTGLPRVHSEGNRIIAREIIFDRNSGKFHYLAPYRVEVHRGTNSIAVK